MKMIDLHTHQGFEPSIIQIRNILAQNLKDQELNSTFSTGLHPWDLDGLDLDECMASIEEVLDNKNLLAIGECGLDRVITVDFAVQLEYFRKQILIAERICKPLIIHCVRAYPDLIQIKKSIKTQIPWIIHGYNGNQENLNALIRHDFYFSVGYYFIDDSKKREVMKQIPIDRLFLETDISEFPIDEVYKLASEVLGIDIDLLTHNLENNFNRIFAFNY